MAEPALDVKSSFRLARRLWPWLAASCLIGAAVGAMYELRLVAPYHASSLVLLPTSSGASSGTSGAGHAAITTYARISESAAVLAPAARQIRSSLSLDQLQSRISTSPEAAGVLKITAAGPSARVATRLANAVADQLVVFVTTSGSAENSTVVALESELKEVDRQITDVQSELVTADQQLASDGFSSPAGKAASQLVSKLTSERASLTLQLDSLKSQVSGAQLEELATNQGTEVIQQAKAATGRSSAGFVLPVGLGVVGGLLLGYVAIVASSRRDRRLRTRDAIAEAVGAPVLLSMESRPPSSPKDWAQMLEQYVPPPSTQWHVRRGLRELGVTGGGGEPKFVRMLAFGDDEGAAAATLEVALVSASTGAETLFSIAGSTEAQVALRSVCARFEADAQKPRPGLTVRNDLGRPLEATYEVVVELHILERAEPEAGASFGAHDAVVLVVSAGRVTAEDLARAAIAVDVVGLRVGGVLVVNPASEDRTVGRFSDGAVRRTMAHHRRPVEPGGLAVPSRSR